MAYNLTEIAVGNDGIVSFIQGVNHVLMYDMLGNLFLIGFAAILYVMFSESTGNGISALMTTSFIIFIVSIFLNLIGIISPIAIYIAISVFALSLILKQ